MNAMKQCSKKTNDFMSKKIKSKHARGCFETVNCKGVILVKEEEITWISANAHDRLPIPIKCKRFLRRPTSSHDT